MVFFQCSLMFVIYMIHGFAYCNDILSYNVKYRIEISSTHQVFNLNEDEVLGLRIKSEHGDADASYRLHQYYVYTHYDIDKQIEYLAKAASQGCVIAQYNYAVILSAGKKVYIQDTII